MQIRKCILGLASLFVVFLYLPTFVFGETIILKNNNKVEAKIVEVTGNFVKIKNSQDEPLVYLLSDIESIEQMPAKDYVEKILYDKWKIWMENSRVIAYLDGFEAVKKEQGTILGQLGSNLNNVTLKGDDDTLKNTGQYYSEAANQLSRLLGELTSLKAPEGLEIFQEKMVDALKFRILSVEGGIAGDSSYSPTPYLNMAMASQKEAYEEFKKVHNEHGAPKEMINEIEDMINKCKPVSQSFLPSHIEAFDNGNNYLKQMNYDEAINEYSKAIQIEPNFAPAYQSRASAYCHKEDIEQCIADCNKAIEINPDYYLAYHLRANAYFHTKKYDKAWEDVHKIQALGHDVSLGFLSDLKQASGR